MAKSIAILLALSVVAAQSASIRNKDTPHKRVVRSCGPCQERLQGPPPPPPPPPGPPPPFPPPPPPPPPLFHTQQWSGYARSADGTQHGVFSGAAAAAVDAQASGQAFSLTDAESGSANLGGQTQGNIGGQTQGNIGGQNQGNDGGFSGKSAHFESKESKFAYHSGGNGGFGQQEIQSGSSGHYNRGQDLEQQQHVGNLHLDDSAQQQQQQNLANGFNSASHSEAQSSSNGFSGRGDQGQVEQFGKYSGSGGQDNTGFHDIGQEQQQTHGQSFGQGAFGSGASSNADSSAGSNTSGSAGLTAGFGTGVGGNAGLSGGNQFRETGQTALHGALDLAAQGLQTANQAGCSTCGKSSYALSNARSHSGSAVAVSIGG